MAPKKFLCRKKNLSVAKLVISKPPVDTSLKRLRCVGSSFVKFCVSNILFQSFPGFNEGNLTKKVEEELPKLRKKLEFYSKGNRYRTSAFVGSFLILNGVKLTSMFLINFVLLEIDEQKNTIPKEMSSIMQMFYDEKKFSKLEAQIGYKFQNRAILLQAFTIASHQLSSSNGTYQRLEFLGDAVLEYLFARHLFNHTSKFAYPEIVRFLAKFIKNQTFASLSKKHGFQNYILKNPNQRIGEKTYADIFESLAAAIYIDSGMNLDEVWKVFYKLMNDLECFNELESNVQICVTQ